MKSAKFLITPFFMEHLPRLLLKLSISMLQLPICYMLEQEISIGMRAMEKKLNILKLQLPIHHILEKEISTDANEDIAKTKREE